MKETIRFEKIDSKRAKKIITYEEERERTVEEIDSNIEGLKKMIKELEEEKKEVLNVIK